MKGSIVLKKNKLKENGIKMQIFTIELIDFHESYKENAITI